MKHVALAYNINKGASPHEAEFDCPLTIDSLHASLSKQWNCTKIEVSPNFPEWSSRLLEAHPDVIFNVGEGFSGEGREAFFPAFFEQLGLRYTGPGVTEMLICQDKHLTKFLLKKQGVPMPAGTCVNWNDLSHDLNLSDCSFPLILKLSTEGSSISMGPTNIVQNKTELYRELRRLQQEFPRKNIIVEQYVPGRDLSMTFIETLGVMGPAEYTYPDSHIYDYRLKTIDNDTITVLPNTNVPGSVLNKLMAISETVIRALSIRSYARLDYRLGLNGEVYLLEVNGQVSFHPIGAFVLACEPHGYDFDAVVHTITKNAFNRVQSDWVFGLR